MFIFMIGSSSVAAGQGCSWKECQGANGSEYLGRCMPASAGLRGCGSFFFSYSLIVIGFEGKRRLIWIDILHSLQQSTRTQILQDRHLQRVHSLASYVDFFWLGCPFLKLWYHPLSEIIIYYSYYWCIEGFPTNAAKCYEWQVGLGRVRGPHCWRFDLVGRCQD